MAEIRYAVRTYQDLERLVVHAAETIPDLAPLLVDRIFEAISILERHPLIGRPVEHGLRELVISRGRTGFVALYSYEEPRDVVLVLGIRHQREAGFEED